MYELIPELGLRLSWRSSSSYTKQTFQLDAVEGRAHFSVLTVACWECDNLYSNIVRHLFVGYETLCPALCGTASFAYVTKSVQLAKHVVDYSYT